MNKLSTSSSPDVKMLCREDDLQSMPTADVDELWYKALDEEDCEAVMMLLKVYPGLLRIGWGNERPFPSKDSEENTPTMEADAVQRDANTKYKRRTALHVAARRGCVDLIKQVLTICNFKLQHLRSCVIMKSSESSKTESSQRPMNFSMKQGEAKTLLAKGVLANWRREVAEMKESYDLDNAATSGSPERSEDGGRDALAISSSPYEHLGVLDRKRFLYMIDSEYQLDAFHMTAVSGREDHLAFLVCASDELIGDSNGEPRLYPVEKKVLLKEDDENLLQLRKATQIVMARRSDLESCFQGYESHLDFKFLPLERYPEYLFHFSFTSLFNDKVGSDDGVRRRFQKELWDEVCWLGGEVWRCLLRLQDGQGRPPIHVAIAEMGERIVDFFVAIDVPHEENGQSFSGAVSYAATRCDAAGRTPVYRASATGNIKALEFMISGLRTTSGEMPVEVAATFHSPWTNTMPLPHSKDLRCSKQMYRSTPLHVAIIHRHFECARQLLTVLEPPSLGGEVVSYMGERSEIDPTDTKRLVELDYVELALLVGDKMMVRLLTEKEYLAEPKEFSVHEDEGYVTALWPVLHIAAARHDYEMLKWITDGIQYTPVMVVKRRNHLRDVVGNSPLHHTLQSTDFGFTFNWLDCVSFDQILSMNSLRPKVEVWDDKRIGEIRGCVSLLIHAGFDTLSRNFDRHTPHPQGYLGENVSFLSWWYKTQMAEVEAENTKLSNTANAMSVTATLIAAASYVGPLQPPLGYDSANQIQYENGWVATFIFFDNMAFYLAIVALAVSFLPYLQGPSQSLFTQYAVKGVFTYLLLAMFSLVVAFASSSMAAVSDNVTSSASATMTIVFTASLGGCCALILFFSFEYFATVFNFSQVLK